MLVANRRALRQALDTQQLDEETEPFLPRVPYDEKMVSGHSILERDEATYHRVCSTLLYLLADWWIKFSALIRFSEEPLKPYVANRVDHLRV